MKKIKLNHQSALAIVSGQVWSTWRLFDDKDLSVGDKVELIDKVDSHNPETWRPIGLAYISKVIEKRLCDVDESDMERHEKYESTEQMIDVFQKYYDPKVDISTPVKIVYFDFRPNNVVEGSAENGQSQAHFDSIKVYADGGSRGNPGPSASGYVIMDSNDTILVDKGVYLGITTNNQAEYQALKFALEEARKMHVKRVDVYMDSLLVTNQMKGIFKVKNRDLWPIHDAIKQLVAKFQEVSFTHVPRELNKLADAAVNRALDEELGIFPK